MVNKVLDELKMDVKEDIKAARSAASIIPRMPVTERCEKMYTTGWSLTIMITRRRKRGKGTVEGESQGRQNTAVRRCLLGADSAYAS